MLCFKNGGGKQHNTHVIIHSIQHTTYNIQHTTYQQTTTTIIPSIERSCCGRGEERTGILPSSLEGETHANYKCKYYAQHYMKPPRPTTLQRNENNERVGGAKGGERERGQR